MATARPLPFPAYFCAHGGGPMPLLANAQWDHTKLVKSWMNSIRSITGVCGKPKAIIVVSAHYNTQVPSVGSDPNPKMLYDYGGFPKESYEIKYPAPGSPEVSRRALELLAAAGIPAKEDKSRPYDHGVFVPLVKMFPDATIPVIPVSVLHNEDPKLHIAMGRALAPLRSEGVFIIGSGFSVHAGSQTGDGSTFNNKLIEVITSEGLSKADRISALAEFLKWPGAQEAQTVQSGTEHFMPLLTVFGSGIDATEDGHGKVAGRIKMPPMIQSAIDVVEFWFGEEAVLRELTAFEA